MDWINVKYEGNRPDAGEPFLYCTVNKKIMVCANRPLDDWFIRKYGVTHWAKVELPKD